MNEELLPLGIGVLSFLSNFIFLTQELSFSLKFVLDFSPYFGL